MKITPRKEAKILGLPKYFTGKSCPKGHICERWTSNCVCLLCIKEDFQRPESIERRRARDLKRSAEPQAKKRKRIYHAIRNAKPNIKKRNREAKALRRLTNINFRLAGNLRSRIRYAIRAGSLVRDLGCSIDAFKLYIERQFRDGMTWDNYGGWHLDHIQPLASFDLSDREQFLIACHYTNYQPLWGIDNTIKGARL